MLRKLLIGGAIAFTILVPYSLALADPPSDGPPGQGVCQHGNSGQTCVPDPQPDNGQDCEEHGNQGGVNEDHCLNTTTTTVVPPSTTTTSTTEPPVTTTETSTTVPTTVTSTQTAPPTNTSVVVIPIGTNNPRPSGTNEKPSKPGSSDEAPSSQNDEPKLAFTGIEDMVPFAAVVLLLLSLGSGALWLGTKKAR